MTVGAQTFLFLANKASVKLLHHSNKLVTLDVLIMHLRKANSRSWTVEIRTQFIRKTLSLLPISPPTPTHYQLYRFLPLDR
ncbi:hypothetical protein KSF78_0004608 [Schistosoma japonicum]|nr:hypothetical protein KSF78_0004608 [Schistosoma japonicum]